MSRWPALDGRQRALLLGGGLVLLAALLVTQLLLPQWREVGRLRQEIARLSLTLQRQPDPAAALAARRREVADLTARLAAALPPAPDSEALLARLQALALRHGVTLLGVAPGGRAELDGFHGRRLQASVAGRYGALVAWLQAVHEMPGPLLVQGFTLAPDGPGGRRRLQLEALVVSPEGAP